MAEPGPAESAGHVLVRTMRRVAAGSALIALSCAVAVVLGSGGHFDELLARGAEAVQHLGKMPAAVNPGKTQALHWGQKYLKGLGLSRTYPAARAMAWRVHKCPPRVRSISVRCTVADWRICGWGGGAQNTTGAITVASTISVTCATSNTTTTTCILSCSTPSGSMAASAWSRPTNLISRRNLPSKRPPRSCTTR